MLAIWRHSTRHVAHITTCTSRLNFSSSFSFLRNGTKWVIKNKYSTGFPVSWRTEDFPGFPIPSRKNSNFPLKMSLNVNFYPRYCIPISFRDINLLKQQCNWNYCWFNSLVAYSLHLPLNNTLRYLVKK